MRTVYWITTALVALVLVLFAVSNRAGVVVAFWPLPVVIGAPLYLVVLLAMLVGFVVGELVAWINGRRWRREARARGRRIEALERELNATQAQLDGAARLPAAAPPPRRSTAD